MYIEIGPRIKGFSFGRGRAGAFRFRTLRSASEEFGKFGFGKSDPCRKCNEPWSKVRSIAGEGRTRRFGGVHGIDGRDSGVKVKKESTVKRGMGRKQGEKGRKERRNGGKERRKEKRGIGGTGGNEGRGRRTERGEKRRRARGGEGRHNQGGAGPGTRGGEEKPPAT